MDNPYAPPKADLLQPTLAEARVADDAVRREGKLLVSRKGVDWPDRCVVCNAPAGGHRARRTLYWHPPAIYLIVLANIIAYAIVASIVRKSGTIRIGVCRRHRTRRALAIAFGWIGAVASLFTMIGGFASGGDVGAAIGIIGALSVIAFAVIGIVLSSLVSPRRIDREHMWIKVGKPFLESF